MRVLVTRPWHFVFGLALGGLMSVVGIACLGSNPAVQPIAPNGPATLQWSQPLEIKWNQQLTDLQVEVSPEAVYRTELGDGGRVAYVYFDPDQDASEYQVTVTDAVSLGGR